jgi:hypothetical protein
MRKAPNSPPPPGIVRPSPPPAPPAPPGTEISPIEISDDNLNRVKEFKNIIDNFRNEVARILGVPERLLKDRG